MKKRLVLTGVFLLLGLFLAVNVSAKRRGGSKAENKDLPELKHEKYVMPNGLQVILHEDHTVPIVSVNVWYHVGSKNEKVRRTGFAHLFEHMMFQGSEHQPGEFFAPLEKVGGSANGSTNEDRTNYWENVPSNYLELALWLEADRMAYLLPAMDLKKLDNQRDVVKNERRQGYENEPYGKIEALMPELLYPAGHPYSWPVIGSHEDLTAASLEDVKDFFRTYYTPSNASLCITGDFEPAKAKALVQKYFGSIPPGPAVERLKDWPVGFEGEKRVTVPDRVSLPRLYYVWHTPPFYAPGDAELDLLANILSSGKTSRLYKSLVYDRQIAQDVTAYQGSRQMGSEFRIMVTAKPGVSMEEIEQAVDEELAKVRSKGVTSQEFSQAQNNWEAIFVRQLQNVGGFGGRADLLNQYNFFLGDPDKLHWDMNRYLGTTAAAIKETAQKYLDPNRRLAAWVVPQPDYRAEKSTVDLSKMPSPAKEPTFNPPKVQKAKLSNGMEVWLAEEHKLPLVQMEVVVKSGWAGDPKGRPGAASLTAELLDEGTRSRSALEISSEAKSLGAQLSTGSFFDGSTASINILKKNLDRGLDLLSDVVLHPVFPAEELERQRQIYLGRIMQESKEPVASAIKAFQKALFGEDHPYSQPYTGSGTESSVKAIQRDDLVNYYETYYAANNATIVAAGDVTMDELLPKLEKAFGNWEQKEVPAVTIPPGPAIRGSKVYIVDKPGAAQSVILMGGYGMPRSSPDYYPFQVMNNVLGGQFSARLNMNLREEKGYSYGSYSFAFNLKGAGPYVAYAPVQAQSTREALTEMKKELAGICGTKPITAEELKNSKNNLIKGYSQEFQTVGAIAGKLAEMVMYGLPENELARYVPSMAAVDGKEAQEMAKKYIRPQAMLTVVVGDRAKLAAIVKELNLGEISQMEEE